MSHSIAITSKSLAVALISHRDLLNVKDTFSLHLVHVVEKERSFQSVQAGKVMNIYLVIILSIRKLEKHLKVNLKFCK